MPRSERMMLTWTKVSDENSTKSNVVFYLQSFFKILAVDNSISRLSSYPYPTLFFFSEINRLEKEDLYNLHLPLMFTRLQAVIQTKIILEFSKYVFLQHRSEERNT